MDNNVCYNCGGTLQEEGGSIVCINCGTHKPKKEIPTEEQSLLYAAYQKLRQANFFEAERDFDDIVRRHPYNELGYWGRLLSKFGIKFEEDYNKKSIPTCYATSIESVYDSSDYKKALEYAEPANKRVFQKHADYIERVRREWLEKASKQEPYDIFISYKDSDDKLGSHRASDRDDRRNLNRTPDSYRMQDLYHQLKERGYRVFFSRESLPDITGDKYEPYIFNALSTAKVMLVYGSKPEYINATWVRNEWTRYLKRIQHGTKSPGSLLVAYEGFAPNDLPPALKTLQCMDAGDEGFYAKLFDKIRQILEQNPDCDHLPVTIPAHNPTFDQPGLSSGVVCSICGKILKPFELIPALSDTQIDIPAFSDIARQLAMGLKIRVNRDGITCTVEGQGNCREKSISIPESIEGFRVTAIGTNRTDHYGKIVSGFASDVTSIIIPSSVTEIGSGAFAECRSLENVRIPVSVTKIGDNAFRGCLRMEAIVIPDSVTDLGGNAFYACTNLNRVELSRSLNAIKSGTFHGCKNLKQIKFPPSIKEIGIGAFENCQKLEDIAIPDSVKTLGDDAFYGCESLESAWIPESVERMGSRVFARCKKLSSIQYSGSEFHWNRMYKSLSWQRESSVCTIIFDAATYVPTAMRGPKASDGLSYRVNPDNKTCTVTGQGSCRDRKIVIPETISEYTVTEISTETSDDFGNPISGFGQNVSEVLIPSTVTKIDDSAFLYSGLKKIVIPDSVTVIGNGAFQWCSNLSSITLSAALTKINSNTFLSCTGLTSVIIPSNVTAIGENAFKGCSTLKSVKLSQALTTIESLAFSDCSRLSEIELPSSLRMIGSEAFSGCMILQTVRFNDTKKQWKHVKLGKNWKKFTLIKKTYCIDGEAKSMFG